MSEKKSTLKFRPLIPVKQKEYGICNFRFLTLSELSHFFKSNLVTIPACMLNSGTVVKKRSTKSLVFIARYLMTSGFLSKSITSLNAALRLVNNQHQGSYLKQLAYDEAFFIHSSSVHTLNLQTQQGVLAPTLETLIGKLYSLKPLFHFYIYKVDKQIYKNSRGRSGRYTFL